MKTKLHAFLLKTTFLLFTTIILGTAFSQTAYKDYQDGKIWIRLKNDKVLTQRATIQNGAEKIDLNNLKLATMPFFRSIFTSHSVTRLAQPFPKAFSSDDLMHTYLIEFSDFNNVDAFYQS